MRNMLQSEKVTRAEIRYYHRQLTKYKEDMTDTQLFYLLGEFTKEQSNLIKQTGKRYTEYELPRPYRIGSMTIV